MTDSTPDKKPSSEAPEPKGASAPKSPAPKSSAPKSDKAAPAAPAGKAVSPKVGATTAKKPVAKKAGVKKSAGKGKPKVDPARVRRRQFVWAATFGALGMMLIWTLRFFFPRVLFEPETRFSIGPPADYAFGVDTKWQSARRIWVVRQPGKLFVIFARCTHLGCTPDWKQAEHKFKCPCHGSGYDSEGINFEGPAPQPMLRTAVEINADGQIIVDKARLFPVDQFNNPAAWLAV